MRPRSWALLAGVLAAALAGLGGGLLGLPAGASKTAGVTALCACWWILEPIPIPATSLIPFAALPLLGVLDHAKVSAAYGHSLVLLLLGGFILSTAIERSGAHRRLALAMVRLVGGRNRRRLVLGFMLATAVCSMWISNTATALMMLPIALAVVDADEDGRLGTPLLLGIAYAASIGGLGTPIGTPPNVVFMGIYEQATGVRWSFPEWMQIGLPAVALLLPLAWVWVVRGLDAGTPIELPSAGPWRPAERRVLAVFGLTALLWITRATPWGGWTGLLEVEGVHDSTVALAAVVVLFLVPDGEGGALLDWKTANRIPWGLLLLFGGGIAIASAFTASGLSRSLGDALSALAAWPELAMVAVLCLSVTFLTEVTSNTATTTLLMPILAAAGVAARIDPALLMVPAALSASCAFMLPVATAPNAIVFGTGRVTTRQMVRAGFVLNLAGAAVLTLVCMVLLG